MNIHEASPETRLIRQELLKMKIGEEITYERLSEITGKKLPAIRGYLASARRTLRDHEGMAFEVIRTQGLRRLNDLEISTTFTDGVLGRRRRQSRGDVKLMLCVQDFASLPNHAQMAHTIKLSFFGAIAFMARRTTLERAAQAVSGRSGSLPIGETLKAFLKE